LNDAFDSLSCFCFDVAGIINYTLDRGDSDTRRFRDINDADHKNHLLLKKVYHECGNNAMFPYGYTWLFK
jgi:hypothetical protein